MKKILFTSLLFLMIGIILGMKILSLSKIENVFHEGTVYYFLQEGVYKTEEILKENTEKFNVKLIESISIVAPLNALSWTFPVNEFRR